MDRRCDPSILVIDEKLDSHNAMLLVSVAIAAARAYVLGNATLGECSTSSILTSDSNPEVMVRLLNALATESSSRVRIVTPSLDRVCRVSTLRNIGNFNVRCRIASCSQPFSMNLGSISDKIVSIISKKMFHACLWATRFVLVHCCTSSINQHQQITKFTFRDPMTLRSSWLFIIDSIRYE